MKILLALILWLSGSQSSPQSPAFLDATKGAVHGRVLKAGSSEAVARATVRLEPTSRGRMLTTTTDEKGNFQFLNLEPGRYRLFAEAPGFLRQEYGQTSVQDPGRIVVVVPPQRLDGDGLILSMSRPPAISGYVSNPLGEPLAAVTVQAYTVRYTPAGKKLALIQNTLTDDWGAYRLFGLNPGSYYVSASYGDHAVRPPGLQLTPNLSNADDGYATLYFPNAVNSQTATIIRVVAGADASNVNIGFADLPRVTIRGQTVGPDGSPIRARLAFVSLNIDPGANMEYPIRADGGGNFRVPSVLPGSYVILAHATTIDGHEVFSEPINVTVGKDDVDLAAVPLFRGIDIVGRVFLADGTSSQTSLDGLSVILTRADGKPSPTPSARTVNGGTFSIADVPAAEYQVSIEPAPIGTYVSGIRMNLNGAVSETLRLSAFQRASEVDAPVMLSLSGSVVDGRVSDAKGDPVAGVQVVLVPEKSWRRRSNYYLVGETDDSGRFEISGVPPASYSGYAFERIETGIYYDADFIARFSDRAEAVNVGKGSRKTISLRVISAAETDGGPR